MNEIFEKHSSELSVAAIENNYEAFDSLIAKGCDPQYNDTVRDVFGLVISNHTPLILAASYNSMGFKGSYLSLNLSVPLEFMEKLLAIEGIDVNVKTSVGFAPIHGAANAPPSKFDMMRMLVDAGADIEARNDWNDTAACRSVHDYIGYNKKNPPIQVNMLCKSYSLLLLTSI